ncbi:glycosyltransferase family 2 protein [Sphingobacterium sp. Ag1]|uniref:glycosyltransferase family 2 protein n=1 Tax=Sphingobacterium sp. Ag1 TaxID=1643451 RepID=UPI00069AFB9A|nr:glycosyltransferase [Sphingobacterium sp. Ag1]
MKKTIHSNLNDPLISIIIPVYNVEAYLRACLDSVIQQTYSRLEVILVNDGSTDGSGKICVEYSEQDQRIKVVNQANGGLSAARNKGLDCATGAYISFIDSDDVIDPNFVYILYQLLVDSAASISMCSYATFTAAVPAHHHLSDHRIAIEVYSGDYMLNNLYNKDWVPKNVIACNKLYHSSVWEGVRYQIGVLHEDEYIIHELYARTPRIAYTPASLYYYRQREASITKEISGKRIDDTLAIFDLRSSYFKRNGYTHLVENNDKAKVLNIALLATTYNNVRTRQLLKQYLSTVLRQGNIPLKMKFSCIFIVCFPKLYWAVKSLKKKTV